jgi:predicted secreted protein
MMFAAFFNLQKELYMKIKFSLLIMVAVITIPVMTYAAVAQPVLPSVSAPSTTTSVQKAAVQAVTPQVVALASVTKPTAVSVTKLTAVTVAPATSATPSYNSVNTRPIQVSSTNPYFTVTLPTNSSTGYMWYLKNYDARLIILLRHNIQASKSAMAGAPGNEVWEFSVNPKGFVAPHMTMVQFEYARPWNLSDHPSIVDFTVVTQ